jgi:hypothetical protein
MTNRNNNRKQPHTDGGNGPEVRQNKKSKKEKNNR